MTHEIILRIPSGDVKMMQELLDGSGDKQNGEVVKTFTATFLQEDGGYPEGSIQADIKIVDADTPYIDAVLFQDGNDVGCLDVTDKLEAEFVFNHFLKDCYIVKVVAGTAEECPKCGREFGWYARIQNRGDCVVDQGGNWERDCQVDDTEIYGPFQCQGCGAEFDERPNNPIKE
jgi:hypothetical protein